MRPCTAAPLPAGLLYQAVNRNRAEQKITRPRAALIKMVLLSQHGLSVSEDTMVQLDNQNCDPGYLCGRLLAVLERIQQLAIPGANATITDRFYGTFSSAPASVAGVLLRKSQAHLGKLRKERPGFERALQARLEEIQAARGGLPSHPHPGTTGALRPGLLSPAGRGSRRLPSPHKREKAEEAAAEAVPDSHSILSDVNHFTERTDTMNSPSTPTPASVTTSSCCST